MIKSQILLGKIQNINFILPSVLSFLVIPSAQTSSISKGRSHFLVSPQVQNHDVDLPMISLGFYGSEICLSCVGAAIHITVNAL